MQTRSYEALSVAFASQRSDRTWASLRDTACRSMRNGLATADRARNAKQGNELPAPCRHTRLRPLNANPLDSARQCRSQTPPGFDAECPSVNADSREAIDSRTMAEPTTNFLESIPRFRRRRSSSCAMRRWAVGTGNLHCAAISVSDNGGVALARQNAVQVRRVPICQCRRSHGRSPRHRFGGHRITCLVPALPA